MTTMAGATPIAQSTNDTRRHVLVVVPRAFANSKEFIELRNGKFADLVAAAERGDGGMSLSDSSAYGNAYYREGDKDGMHAGKPTLYCEGYVR